MIRFSIGSKVKKDEEFKAPGAPEDRRRSRLETKPGVSNPAVRSKSFKVSYLVFLLAWKYFIIFN